MSPLPRTPGATYSSSGTVYTGEATWPAQFNGAATMPPAVGTVTMSIQRLSNGLFCNAVGCSSTSPIDMAQSGPNITAWERAFPASQIPAGGRYQVAVTATSTDGFKITRFVQYNVDYNPDTAVFVSPSGSDSNNGLCPIASGGRDLHRLRHRRTKAHHQQRAPRRHDSSSSAW